MAAVEFDTIRSKAFGSITAAYTVLGSALTVPWRMMRIVNNTNGDLFISDDGTNDKIFIPAGGFVLYDLNANELGNDDSRWFVLAAGTQLYVKYSSAPSSGSVYAEGVYSMGV